MDWKMETVYIGCAAVGGTILVLQTLLLLFGAGDHDTDVHVDEGSIGHSGSGEEHAQDVGFGLLSVRTISAFLTFFGLAGWYGVGAGWAPLVTVLVALAAGFAMLFAVAFLLHAQKKLASSGTVDLAGAVGHAARVYLRIPERNSGKGKITLLLQGRTVELSAFTNGASIATGSEVRVVRQVTGDTFEVEPLTQPLQERTA
jgi:hypothetical protein